MSNQIRRDGYIDAARLYTADGINAAVGLSVKALDEGRQGGWLHPVSLGNRLWYSGEELIKWIQAAGRPAARRQSMEV